MVVTRFVENRICCSYDPRSPKWDAKCELGDFSKVVFWWQTSNNFKSIDWSKLSFFERNEPNERIKMKSRNIGIVRNMGTVGNIQYESDDSIIYCSKWLIIYYVSTVLSQHRQWLSSNLIRVLQARRGTRRTCLFLCLSHKKRSDVLCAYFSLQHPK